MSKNKTIFKIHKLLPRFQKRIMLLDMYICIYIHTFISIYLSCYGSIPLALGLIGRDGGLSTLYHSCGFACQQRVLKRDISRFSFVLRVSPRCQLLITDYVFGKKVSLIIFRHKFYQNLACGAHFQFTNHDLFEKVDWS